MSEILKTQTPPYRLSDGTGKLHCQGRVCIDASPSATLQLHEDFFLGWNLRNGSNAETYLKLHDGAVLTVHHTFKAFFTSSIELFANAHLELGNSYINSGSVISCKKHIVIGDGVAIARNAAFYDSDMHMLIDPSGNQTNSDAPIVIEDHVWIGFGAIILKGVTLGTGCVIGAGAVVTHDIPPHCIAVGNPAKVICEEAQWK